MSVEDQRAWVVTQIGAREHYAVARALAGRARLAALVTDLWADPKRWASWLPYKPLRERYHRELTRQSILVNNLGAIFWELKARGLGWRGDRLFMERNLWFEKEAIHLLEAFLKTSKREPQVLFAYSYAALGIIKWAKKRGWKTILGQIDPGIEEENIVAKLADKHRVLAPDWRRIDGDYWERWKEECAAADRIMVNSSWSKELVERSGVDGKKIDVVPLAYDRGTEESHKSYPHQFESSRPLRVLFLGQVSLRKGIAEVLEAARILRGKPIEFQIVGPVQIDLEAAGKMGWDSMQVKFIGTVPRSEVNRYYEQADLFLFPTHSDGFGLTQLEAQRRRLPLLVSRYCGEVVKNGVNGFILKEVTGEAIAKSLMQLLDQPELLSQCSQSSGVDASFSADSVAEKILNLA